MRLQLTLLFILVTAITYSQHVIIFKDMKTLRCQSVKFRDEAVLVKTESGDEQRIPVDQVDSYYNPNRSTIFYLRPSYIRELNLVNLVAGEHDYKLFEREIHGHIDVFSYTESSHAGPPGMPPMVQVYHFLQKDSIFQSLFPQSFSSREKTRQHLLKLVGDNADISAKVNAPDFLFTARNILRAIREYNLLTFQSPGKKAFEKTSSVSVYTSWKSKQDTARVVVNDSITYSLVSKYPTTIHLPTNIPSKVCVTTNEGALCDVITANSFMMEYYELMLTGKGRPTDIELRPVKYVQEYIRRISQR
jgi:hypothetical protein